MFRKTALPLAVLSTLALSAPLAAADGKFDLGLRGILVTGNGVPTNDIGSYGLFGHYKLNERWQLGFGVDHSAQFDFERVPETLGFFTPKPSDAKGTMTAVTAWIERVYPRPEGRLEWFWGAGTGINSVSTDSVAGPILGGGTYDIVTDTGTELLLFGTAGLRRWFGNGSWGIEAALRSEQHFADWKVSDRVSGRSFVISDYLVNGVQFGVIKRF